MSLVKNRYVKKPLEIQVDVAKDGTVTTRLIVRTFLNIVRGTAGFKEDDFNILVQHVVEYWKANPDLDAVTVVSVEEEKFVRT
jgi:hypothetical protein